MMDRVMFVLAFAAAIGSGLVAGIFFAFSNFVMAALGRLPASQGMAAMNAINVTVINPGFFLAFFGTAVLCLALIAGTLLGAGRLPGLIVVAACLIYLVGVIGVTMRFNVPLNNALAAAAAGTPEAEALWSSYLKVWTGWNTVRTVAPLVAAILFTAAIL